MRVLRLDLFAFGTFTNGKLDFSRKPGALQLIYGPNEAGKSTTLRALLALLYGIPIRTSDAHLHDMTRLRIGAALEDERGHSLTVVRRKGAKQTLLDAEGKPLSESALTDMLGGIDEALFRNVFGLDHQRLREGAEALLAGGGQVGEGLFDASLGSRALRDVKEALRLEADELYKSRGKTPKLNQALDALREKMRKKRDAALAPSAFVEQTRALELSGRRRHVALGQRRELLTEQSRLGRMLELLPLINRYDSVLAELRSLPARAHSEPSAASAAPEMLEQLTRELERRYGVVLSAQADLPALSAECATLERELEALRERLGNAAHMARPLDTPQRTRLRRQWEEQAQHVRRQRELEEQTLSAEEELRASQERIAELVGALGDQRLEALLASLEREDLPASLLRVRGELERKSVQLERGLAQLGLALDAERLSRLALPDQAALSELERGFADNQRTATEASQRLVQLQAKHSALRLSEAELLAEGELATLVQLEAARQAREEAFGGVLARAPADAALVGEYRSCVARADELSDRLRREAARSHELSRLRAETALLEEERASLDRASSSIEGERVRLTAELAALLTPCQLAGESLRTARTKLPRLESLRELAADIVAQRALQATLQARAAEWAGTLSPLLGDVPPVGDIPPAALLSDVLAVARARVLRDQSCARELELLRSKVSDASARTRALSRQLAACIEERAQSARDFAAELARGGFDAGLAPDELLACLDDMTLLFEGTRKLAALRARIESSQAQSGQLRGELQSVVAKFVPAAAGLALGEQLEALSRVQREQRESQRDQTRLELDKGRLEAELARLGDGQDLAVLRRGISSVDPDAARARLFEIEGSIAALDEEIGTLDQEIGRLDAGLTRLTEAPYAVSIAEEVEAELVNVRMQLRRYLEVKLSLALIAREVEKHRSAHQGPLLSRASGLFTRLTLERYGGLSVELDERDEPVLCAVRSSGEHVRVAGLSDGTRDQLYLALRLASIERFLGRGTTLPLVLDDAFIHFDDARAQAALLVLGELSVRTQVLFFTHHARMVELAKRALPPTQLAVHELDAARGTVAFRDNGPLFAGA